MRPHTHPHSVRALCDKKPAPSLTLRGQILLCERHEEEVQVRGGTAAVRHELDGGEGLRLEHELRWWGRGGRGRR